MQKYRKDGDFSIALGTELTLELLKQHPDTVRGVYVHSKQNENEIYREIINICEREHVEVIRSDKAFNVAGAKENCYIMGVFSKFSNPIRKDTNHVVLVNPSNMGNLGTIIRSCVGFGLSDLAIISPAADIYDPKVIRATMRAFFGLHFSYFDSFEEYLKYADKREIYTFMLDGAEKLHEADKKEHYSLVFGNEATGLDPSFSKYHSIFIEQLNTIDSLNLDNAVSIAAYEFTKGKL